MDDLLFQLMKLKAKGYCCAQIVMILALEAEGKTNEDLVRSAGGLCFGIIGSGEVCGALSGGACLISLYAGKGADDEAPHDQYMDMMGELTDWFKEVAGMYGGTTCDEILSKFPDRSACGRIVVGTYEKCMGIFTHYGIDPSMGKNE